MSPQEKVTQRVNIEPWIWAEWKLRADIGKLLATHHDAFTAHSCVGPFMALLIMPISRSSHRAALFRSKIRNDRTSTSHAFEFGFEGICCDFVNACRSVIRAIVRLPTVQVTTTVSLESWCTRFSLESWCTRFLRSHFTCPCTLLAASYDMVPCSIQEGGDPNTRVY